MSQVPTAILKTPSNKEYVYYDPPIGKDLYNFVIAYLKEDGVCMDRSDFMIQYKGFKLPYDDVEHNLSDGEAYIVMDINSNTATVDLYVSTEQLDIYGIVKYSDLYNYISKDYPMTLVDDDVAIIIDHEHVTIESHNSKIEFTVNHSSLKNDIKDSLVVV